MYRISKRFSFAAAHHLPHLPEGHKCKRPHGHNYEVELHLKAETLDDRGFVLDYAELDVFKHWLQNGVDHTDLNEHPELKSTHTPTTAEYLARWFGSVATRVLALPPRVQLEAVVVRETENTSAEWSPD